MKICPKCNQTFSDENSFCLMDGTTLIIGSQEQQIPLSFSTDSNDAPTQFISAPRATTSENSVQPSAIPGWLYMVIGIMGTALIALVAFIFLMPDGKDNSSAASATNTTSDKEISEATEKSAKEDSQKADKTASDDKDKSTKQMVSSDTPTIKVEESEHPKADPSFSPTGNWSGDWTSKSTDFTATTSLNESNGKVEGQINWHLTRTKNPKKINKIGSSATEYVRGTFNSQTGAIFLKGYRKDDPNNVVILDKYNLTLSKNNQQISGKSINGRFVLRR